MASSGYYYNLYKQYRSEVSKLQKNISTLTKVRNSISSDFFDEQRSVNNELNNLKEDLKRSARHDNIWDSNASKCELYKEKASSADKSLDSSMESLDAEISSLESKKSTAESNRDQAYRDYERAKEEEYREFLESLKIFKK